jgi:hypothetical protein
MTHKPICSIKHFERLLKSFEKIAYNQYENNNHITRSDANIDDYLENLTYGLKPRSVQILNKFKHNQYKTHSCFKDKSVRVNNVTFWVSYTVEDQKGKRVRGKDFTNTNMVFKVFIQVDNHRKKRIIRWIVPMTWHNEIQKDWKEIITEQ